MSFLDDIKKQPQQTREIMFFLSVFITVLVIGMIWFHSFQKNLYTLMNPEEDVKEMFAIENTQVVPSLFGSVWQVAGDVKGLVFGLLSGGGSPDDNVLDLENLKNGKVYTFPLSEYK